MKAGFDERGVVVQAGDMIARRFRLVRTEEYDLPGATRFVAHDVRLNREVTIDLISSLAPTAVVRAAHRAQLARDRRLTRVITAGVERVGKERQAYVITERPDGVHLEDLLGTVAFVPATAAAIVGEACGALRVAARSDMHHGKIRARSLTATQRGRVVLSGMAIEGELASQAGVEHGRSERDDAIALARLFVGAVTAADPDEITADDLPDDLSSAERDLCEALLRGSGPTSLDDVAKALGSGNSATLRTLVAEAPTLWWPVPPSLALDAPAVEASDADVDITEIAEPVDIAVVTDDIAEAPEADTLDEAAAEAAADTVVEADATTESIEVVGEAAQETAVPVDEPEPRLRTRFGGAVDDIDEFHDIVTAQNEIIAPSVMEAILARLHRRFPRSDRLADLAAAAHRRAVTPAPFNVGPLVLGLLIVGVFVAAVIGASLITQPIDIPFDGHDNPSQTYPEYTYGQTPAPSAEE